MKNLNNGELATTGVHLECGQGTINLGATSENYTGFSGFDKTGVISAKSNGLALYTSSDYGTIRFHTSHDGALIYERMRITSAGEVGIGTKSPSQKLDVNGNLRVRGDIIVDGTGGEEPVITISELIDLLNKQGIIPNNFAGTVTDIDGNVYKTVQIGDQVWMAENLRVTHYPDSTPILLVEDSIEWSSFSYDDQAYCWYDNNPTNGNTYGALYTWAAVMNGESSSNLSPSGIQGVCPDGWHLPSDEEWMELEIFLGMSPADAASDENRGTDEGGKLKEAGTLHWLSPNTGANNMSGFTALPGGFRHPDGSFRCLGTFCFIWSSTELASHIVESRSMSNFTQSVGKPRSYKDDGLSVRCVKDSP